MPISTLNGVAWASISSYRGVSKASIATINGVAGVTPPAFDEELTRTYVFTASTTTEITLTKGVAAGKRLVVLSCLSSGSYISSITDSRLNSYTVHQLAGGDGTATQRVSVASGHISTALQIGDKVTITWNNSVSQAKVIFLAVLSNCAASGQPDVTRGRSVYQQNVSEPASTVAQNTVAIGLLSYATTGSTYTLSSWSISGTYNDQTTRRVYLVYSAFTSSGSKNPGGTWGATNAQANAWVAFN